jgi:CRP-like cAMP-binding protein
MDVQEAIKNAPLFAHLSKKDLRQLAATMSPRSYPAGAVIIEKGKAGMGFFIIASGSAKVTVKGDRIRTLKSGDLSARSP